MNRESKETAEAPDKAQNSDFEALFYLLYKILQMTRDLSDIELIQKSRTEN